MYVTKQKRNHLTKKKKLKPWGGIVWIKQKSYEALFPLRYLQKHMYGTFYINNSSIKGIYNSNENDSNDNNNEIYFLKLWFLYLSLYN